MSIYKSISLIMRNTFLITTLFLIAFAGNAHEKAASLILKEAFGSDPYNKMAYHDGVLLVSGLTGVGSGDKSGTIDVLRYSDKGFDLISQTPLISPKDDLPYRGILGLSYVNGYWVILAVNSFGSHLVSATLKNGKLFIVNELSVHGANSKAQLISGNRGNLYVVSSKWAPVKPVNPRDGLSVVHFNIEDNGTIKHNSAVNFGIRPNEAYYSDSFSVSYDNHALYLTSNQYDTPAGLYKLPLADDGSPQAAVELTLKNAKSKYRLSKMSGDLWLLSYENWGFQVAQLKGDALQVIFEHESNSRYSALEVKGNLIFGLNTFGEMDVFQIGHDKTISHRFTSRLLDSGFNRDMLIADDTLFITQSLGGISALKIEDNTTLTNLHSFSQSGVIEDIAMQGNELAVAAFNRNLYFWGMGDTDPASLNATYHGGYSIQGVVWEDDEMVINDGAQLESHLVENLKNNINVGTRHGSLGSQGSDGQIIKLKNGYAAAALGRLSFFDESKNIMSTIITSRFGSYTEKVEMVVSEHLLFISMGLPNEVAVYDTSDLSNVTELTRIKRRNTIYGNVAVKGNYLYVPVDLENGRFVITPYNISNPAEPILLPSVEVGSIIGAATLHIDGNYLMVVGSHGSLFDISVPEKPALVDENSDINTNGIGAGFGSNLFTVPLYSRGRLQRSQINFAPHQGDLTLNLDEDGQTMTALSPSDNENDSVTFSILDEPTKGTVTIQDNISLSYVGVGNANGTDTAKLLVTDAHGGASEFNLTINIKPINDAPLFNDQPVTLLVGLGQSKRVALDVTDVDGDKLTFEITDQATLGSADVDSQGVVTYAPNTSTAGTDSFVVMVSDAVGMTASKKVNVTISTQPVATTPIATGNSNDSSGGTVSWFYLVGLLLVGMQRRYTL